MRLNLTSMTIIAAGIALGFVLATWAFAQPAAVGGLTTAIVESMELQFIEDDPKIFIEVDYECDQYGCEWEILTEDKDIVAQVTYEWSGEIHCQQRIKSLEVDHPSTFEDGTAFELANDAVYSTLVQNLPTQSPFKTALVGTFTTQSFQVEYLKNECMERIQNGSIDPYSEVYEPSVFIQGMGQNRLFLRGQCGFTNNANQAFDQPSSGSDQPDGIPYSPFTTLYCVHPTSPFANQSYLERKPRLTLHSPRADDVGDRKRKPRVMKFVAPTRPAAKSATPTE